MLQVRENEFDMDSIFMRLDKGYCLLICWWHMTALLARERWMIFEESRVPRISQIQECNLIILSTRTYTFTTIWIKNMTSQKMESLSRKSLIFNIKAFLNFSSILKNVPVCTEHYAKKSFKCFTRGA